MELQQSLDAVIRRPHDREASNKVKLNVPPLNLNRLPMRWRAWSCRNRAGWRRNSPHRLAVLGPACRTLNALKARQRRYEAGRCLPHLSRHRGGRTTMTAPQPTVSSLKFWLFTRRAASSSAQLMRSRMAPNAERYPFRQSSRTSRSLLDRWRHGRRGTFGRPWSSHWRAAWLAYREVPSTRS